MAFIIFFRRHAVFFFKGAEEMIVSSESSHFVNFGDRHALDDVFLAHTEPVFGDVAVQRLSGLFLEFPANMVAAHKKNFFQTFQSEFLGNCLLYTSRCV